MFQPDLNLLFVGRDVFGRLSLVCAKYDDDVIISDIVQNSSANWTEVPYAQVCCIDTENRCAVSTSYLSIYPENVLEPWAKLFSSFTLDYLPCKDVLLKVSRTTSSPTLDVQKEFFERLVEATRSMIPPDANSIAVAFSGGVDSLLVSIALHEAYPLDQTIDLVNVAFIRGSEHRSIVTDRQRAVAALLFLRSRFPARKWCLVLVDVTLEELEENRSKHIVKAAAPARSVLDESLACVLWFALRGVGKDYDSGDEIRSDAHVYFVGSGADELFAGYARHRTRFERDDRKTLMLPLSQECEAELCRLGSRNGGRDARVAAVLRKELRAPFLHDDFVAWVNSVPMHLKWDLTQPRGVGEKMIIRQVLASYGAPHDAPKQAMQFGSGFVKMQNNKTIKGSDVSRNLLGPHHSISADDLQL
ncbi:asparagine synthase [Cooperia oncophora]